MKRRGRRRNTMPKKTRNFKKLADVLDVPGYHVNYDYGYPQLVCKGHKRLFDRLATRTVIAVIENGFAPAKATYKECRENLVNDWNKRYGGWENMVIDVFPHISTKKHKYGKTMKYWYYSINDSRTGKSYSLPVSNFVWMATHPNEEIPDGYDIDHIDGNSLNNEAANLQCITRKENLAKRKGAKNQYSYIKKGGK